MNPDYQALPLLDNIHKQRFELVTEDATSLVQYRLHRHYLSLIHTQVPAALQGQGVGSTLVEKVLHQAAERNLTLFPLCPFVARYIQQHSEWYRLVAPRYQPTSAHYRFAYK